MVDLTADACEPLRREVLRGGDPDAVVAFPEDHRAGAFHLGVRDDAGAVVGVASFSPSPTAVAPGREAWQLRGMAVRPDRQGSGAGRLLLEAAFARLRDLRAELLWANARDTAIPFYERCGMRVVGDGFLMGPNNTIPHHVVVIDL